MHALLKDEAALEAFLYQNIYKLNGVVRVNTQVVINVLSRGLDWNFELCSKAQKKGLSQSHLMTEGQPFFERLRTPLQINWKYYR